MIPVRAKSTKVRIKKITLGQTTERKKNATPIDVAKKDRPSVDVTPMMAVINRQNCINKFYFYVCKILSSPVRGAGSSASHTTRDSTCLCKPISKATCIQQTGIVEKRMHQGLLCWYSPSGIIQKHPLDGKLANIWNILWRDFFFITDKRSTPWGSSWGMRRRSGTACHCGNRILYSGKDDTPDHSSSVGVPRTL